MGKKLIPDERFAKAIPGSGGIFSTIAKRVGCSRQMASIRINASEELMEMYNQEKEALIDDAESIVTRNIAYLKQAQDQLGAPVDSVDAKWYLTVKAKQRGYSTRTELTGADGEEVKVGVGIDMDKI